MNYILDQTDVVKKIKEISQSTVKRKRNQNEFAWKKNEKLTTHLFFALMCFPGFQANSFWFLFLLTINKYDLSTWIEQMS